MSEHYMYVLLIYLDTFGIICITFVSRIVDSDYTMAWIEWLVNLNSEKKQLLSNKKQP